MPNKNTPLYVIFDTETTGLPRSRKASISDVDNWPRIVQIAWEAFDGEDRKIESQCHTIRPDGFTIPIDAQRVHGISTSMAMDQGVPISEALAAFAQVVSGSSTLVGHNLKFDTDVLGAEFHRLGKGDPFRGKTHLCTMHATTQFCALPGPYGLKSGEKAISYSAIPLLKLALQILSISVPVTLTPSSMRRRFSSNISQQ
jgi:DNA polymerase III epsilon subunit-like protein